MGKNKRKMDICIISDTHLGTRGSCALELNDYLKSINPKILILNGDIIDGWRFNRNYFPKPHVDVIRRILKMASNGTKVYYITGNHDEFLRQYDNIEFTNIEILNKLELDYNNKKILIFHGDVFDIVMKHSKWLGIVGSWLYDMLIWMNTKVNQIRFKLGFERVSFSAKLKNMAKGAVKFINDFEDTAVEYAKNKGFDIVCCGHIHQPKYKSYKGKDLQNTLYLNSGDWIENLTSIECSNGIWRIYDYLKDSGKSRLTELKTNKDDIAKENKEIVKSFYDEFK